MPGSHRDRWSILRHLPNTIHIKGTDMKTVATLFEAMLTKQTTPVWTGRPAPRVDGPTAFFTWDPPKKR